MHIAVTGGCGFIGKAVIRAAEIDGDFAWSFDRANGEDVMGPLDNLGECDSVIHLAGMLGTSELFDAPHAAVDVNVHGTLNVLEWCARNRTGYVGITMPPAFPSVYTATKICADRLASAWHNAHGIRVSKVRAFNAYGAGQKHGPGHPQKIVPTFATEAWNNRPIPIWGDGSQTVDLVHVDDLGRMLVEATRFWDDETLDGGTGVGVTVNELAEFVIEHTESKAGITYLPMRKGEVPTRIVAQGEGWSKLGWSPEFSWEKIAESVDWYHPDNQK